MEKEKLTNSIEAINKEILNDSINNHTLIIKKYFKDFSRVGLQPFDDLTSKQVFSERLDLLINVSQALYKQLTEKTDMESLIKIKPWQILEERFPDFITQWPEEIDLPYSEDETTVSEKYKKRKLAHFLYRRKNKRYRSKILKKEATLKARFFSVHLFIRNYVFVPIANQLFEEDQQFLFTFAKMLHQLHTAAEDLKDNALLANEMQANTDYWQLVIKQDLDDKIKTYLAACNEAQKIIETYKKEALNRSNTFQESLLSEISDLWEIAGSPLLAAQKFGQKTIEKRLKKLNERKDKAQNKWKSHLNGTLSDWSKDQELANLQLMITQLKMQTLETIKLKIKDTIIPHFEEVDTVIKNALKKFVSKRDITEDLLRKTILSESQALIRTLRQDKLPALHDALVKSAFDKTYTGFLNQINSKIDELNDEQIIFTKLDLEGIPPQSELDDVPLKELMQGEIITSAYISEKELSSRYNSKMQSLQRSISNLDQIVEFNLEAAYNLLNEKDEHDALKSAQKIAVEGLERAQSNIEDMQENFSETIIETNKKFDLLSLKLQSDIQKLGDNEKILELKLRLARAQTKEKYIKTRQDIWLRIKKIIPHIVSFLKTNYTKIRDEYLRIRKVTGLGPQIKTSHEVMTEFVVNTERNIKKMPYVYQRLFRLEPLEEKRFFYGRNKQMQFFADDIEQFKQGNHAATALVGEKGNGKTTILNFAIKEYFAGFEIVKIDLSKTVYNEREFLEILAQAFSFSDIATMKQFEEQLTKQNKKVICIIENVHNLFMRIIDGFEVFEQLLLLISRTRYNIFWIVTSGFYAWEYLDKVLNVSDFFRRTITLQPLSEKEVMEVITNRHQVSGYGLTFLASEKVKKSRAYKKLTTDEEQQKYLKDLLFKELADISGGNIKSAILFWLSVLQTFEDEKIIVAEEIFLDTLSIYQLSAIDMFSLAAFIQHEYLTEEQHAMVFNQELDASRLILSRLYKKGYLTRTSENYSVHPLLYRPVIKALKHKNILL